MFFECCFKIGENKCLEVEIDDLNLRKKLLECIKKGKVQSETKISFNEIPFRYLGCTLEDMEIEYRNAIDKPETLSTKEFNFEGKVLDGKKLSYFNIPKARIVEIGLGTASIEKDVAFTSASLYIPYNTDILVKPLNQV